jgi:hypothetical protein
MLFQVYQTAWVDKKWVLYFSKDLYGRDQMLTQALFGQEYGREEQESGASTRCVPGLCPDGQNQTWCIDQHRRTAYQ